MKKLILALVVMIIAVGLGIGGYFYWNKIKKDSEIKTTGDAGNSAQKITDDATQGVLPDISANPLENKPEVNPVDKTNPFKNIKTNPFE